MQTPWLRVSQVSPANTPLPRTTRTIQTLVAGTPPRLDSLGYSVLLTILRSDSLITLLRAHETVSGYTIRAWTGPATDEGVGIIALLEVSDASGRPVCRFEEFLDAAVQRTTDWPRDEHEASLLLQQCAKIGRASCRERG